MTTATIRHSSYFYPRSPRGERLMFNGKFGGGVKISIHAPREGSDPTAVRRENSRPISIHAPREGSDGQKSTSKGWKRSFLSTLPARGATGAGSFLSGAAKISIHAPREGSDSCGCATRSLHRYFYPRSPRGERPLRHFRQRRQHRISIHAPREGSDQTISP